MDITKATCSEAAELTWTTKERVETLRRYIAERRRLAEVLRARTIGSTIERAEHALREAEMCDNLAEGMERALSILFP